MTSQDGRYDGSSDPSDPSDEEARAAELGERLAGWLEGLGLDAHLAEAGLPAYERDEHGRAGSGDQRGDAVRHGSLRGERWI